MKVMASLVTTNQLAVVSVLLLAFLAMTTTAAADGVIAQPNRFARRMLDIMSVYGNVRPDANVSDSAADAFTTLHMTHAGNRGLLNARNLLAAASDGAPSADALPGDTPINVRYPYNTDSTGGYVDGRKL
eukprot:jgi/Chrzof1/3011/Cz12g08050.t1